MNGTCPYTTLMISTATAESPTATHCATRSRSFRKITPKLTDTSGLMKYPREASIVRPVVVAST